MSIDCETAFEADFPVPAEQAEALLEICQGDVVEARRIADINLEFAGAEEMRRYWSSVGACLSKHVFERWGKCLRPASTVAARSANA